MNDCGCRESGCVPVVVEQRKRENPSASKTDLGEWEGKGRGRREGTGGERTRPGSGDVES